MLNQTRALWGIARESILHGPGIRRGNVGLSDRYGRRVEALRLRRPL